MTRERIADGEQDSQAQRDDQRKTQALDDQCGNDRENEER
jgi:hypothetical protein